MELRHLRYFAAVAETMNFRQAAQHLNMTQPPLSQQIQQLEMELGFELFHRHGRSITLTTAGAAFLTEVDRILELVDSAVKRGQQAARGEIGRLHIGFVESAAYRLLPAILRIFREQYPDVEVTLSSMTTNQQLSALLQERIDLGICRVSDEDIDHHLQAETVFREPLCAVLPRNHRLGQRQTLQVDDLADESLVLFPQHLGDALFDHIAKVCQRAGFTLRVEQVATQLTTIVGLVAAGLGVSLLPASVMELPHSGVTYRLLPESGYTPMSMVWRNGEPSPTLHNFLTIARSYSESEA